MNKRSLKHVVAWFLCMCLVLQAAALPVLASGEEVFCPEESIEPIVASEMETPVVEETTVADESIYQPIVVSAGEAVALTAEETSYYQEIAWELASQSEGDAVSVVREEETVLYRMKDAEEFSDEKVLQEITYSSKDDTALSLTGYAEITLSGGTESIGSDDASLAAPAVLELSESEAFEEEAASEEADAGTLPDMSVTDEKATLPEESLSNEETEPASGNVEEKAAEETVCPEEYHLDTESALVSFAVEEPEAFDIDIPAEEANGEAVEIVFGEPEDNGEALNLPENFQAEDQESAKDLEDANGEEVLTEEVPGVVSVSALNTRYNDEYNNTVKTIITAENLLQMIEDGNEFAITFGNKLGFGKTPGEIAGNLRLMVDEYYSEIKKGNTFQEPHFVINGVDIVLNKTIEEVNLVANPDGTYSASLIGDQPGYRTSVMIDADASVSIVYDEKGETKIERRVVSEKPTDFVITLDISPSMLIDDREGAMFSALRVVLDEILSVKENKVSIVLWSSEGAQMELYVDGNGRQRVFSGADGTTVTKMFGSDIVASDGRISSTSLSEATVENLRLLYDTGGWTAPEKGLAVAMEVLRYMKTDDGHNTGVILFTDGKAEPFKDATQSQVRKSEETTVDYERYLAETYNATIVNVSIGDEDDVTNYERYLDPTSRSYYRRDDEWLKEHVLYYNIPKLTNQELADRVSTIFEVAFEDITTETRQLQSETITDGILAAYASNLIETIPNGFQLVRMRGDDGSSYRINGLDDQGNTTITFGLDDLVSGQDKVVSYCVIPTGTDNSIGVTAYSDGAETVLYTKPVDRIAVEEKEQEISITVTKTNTEIIEHAELPENVAESDHVHEWQIWLIDRVYSVASNTELHYISRRTEQQRCSICGAIGDTIVTNISEEEAYKTPHLYNPDGKCWVCGFDNHMQYYSLILQHIENDEELVDEYVEASVRNRLLVSNVPKEQIDEIINALKNPAVEPKYKVIYLLSFYNYMIDGKAKLCNTSNYSDVSNELQIKHDVRPDNYVHTFFHESGHSSELNLQSEKDGALTPDNPDYVEFKSLMAAIQDECRTDVKNKIRATLNNLEGANNLTDEEKQEIINAFISSELERTRETVEGETERMVPLSLESNGTLSNYYRMIRDQIESELTEICRRNAGAYNATMASDIYGGYTNNKLYGGFGHPAVNADGTGYWYDESGDETLYQGLEAWAEFFSAKIRGDNQNINDNSTLFPTATGTNPEGALERMADFLEDYYIRYYTKRTQQQVERMLLPYAVG